MKNNFFKNKRIVHLLHQLEDFSLLHRPKCFLLHQLKMFSPTSIKGFSSPTSIKNVSSYIKNHSTTLIEYAFSYINNHHVSHFVWYFLRCRIGPLASFIQSLWHSLNLPGPLMFCFLAIHHWIGGFTCCWNIVLCWIHFYILN